MAERDNRRNDRNREENDGLTKKLIAVNRVTKVVKGGRNMRFSALVVVGDENGKVGLGMGKAAEVPEAIEKATQIAKRSMHDIALKGTTIPHHAIGKFGRGQVVLLPAETRYRRHRGRPRACGPWKCQASRTSGRSPSAPTTPSTARKPPSRVFAR